MCIDIEGVCEVAPNYDGNGFDFDTGNGSGNGNGNNNDLMVRDKVGLGVL